LRVVRRTRSLPTLFWLLFLGPTVLGTAEGLALAYAHELGGGETLAGLFLAATPLGAVLGLAWVGKMTPRLRARVLFPFSLVVGGCVAVAGLVATPVVVIAAMFVAGVAMGHVAHLQAAIVGLVGAEVRGRIIGLANTILQIGQAGSILLTGFVAEAVGIREVFVCAGLTATAGVILVAVLGTPYAGKHRAEHRVRAHPRSVVQPAPRDREPDRIRARRGPRRPVPATEARADGRARRPRATQDYAGSDGYTGSDDYARDADSRRSTARPRPTAYPRSAEPTRYADYTGHADYVGRTARDRRSGDDRRYGADDQYDQYDHYSRYGTPEYDEYGEEPEYRQYQEYRQYTRHPGYEERRGSPAYHEHDGHGAPGDARSVPDRRADRPPLDGRRDPRERRGRRPDRFAL
ncbi:MAG TPA: MFS transporter, partial [Actinopolymorphaceae bacterium]